MPSARCLSLAFLLSFLPHAARAQSAAGAAAPAAEAHHREMRLSWVRHESAASCPDAGHVEADVEQRLGWSPFIHSSAASESIEASVSRTNDVWRAEIELRAPDGSSMGSRTVESPAATCASLSAAAGLAIALMIEPLLPPQPTTSTPTSGSASTTTSTSAPEANKPLPPPTTTNATTAELTKPRAETSSPREARGDLTIGALGATRILPHAALGVSVAGSTRLYDRWFAAVSASWLPEQHVQLDAADVGFGITLGALGPCYRIPIGSDWSFASCVSLLVGSLQISVTNPEPIAPGARLWWAASTGLRLGWNTGPLEATLGVDALAHVTRHNYQVGRSEPQMVTSLFLEPAVALTSSLALGVRY